jgi:catechol 2,3-dioxygenase-like lactoylglutathione lyase family enzyme
VIVQDLAIASVTVPGARLDEVATIYHDTFGWEVVWDGALAPALAAAWGIAPAGRRVVLLGAPGETRGQVRLIEGETPPPPPLATFGWSSLEITVRNCDELAERLRHHPQFRINGEPRDLMFSTDPPGQRAMQAVGPAGEQLYLTQILRQTPGHELAVPPPGADVGAVFIAVLATREYEAAKAFYVDVLGYDPYLDGGEVALTVARKEMGLPEETRFRLGALRPRGETRIELDGYPAGAGRERERRPGELPPGFGVASLLVTDLEQALSRAETHGYRVLAPAVPVETPPYYGRRSATLVGGAGELVELIGA